RRGLAARPVMDARQPHLARRRRIDDLEARLLEPDRAVVVPAKHELELGLSRALRRLVRVADLAAIAVVRRQDASRVLRLSDALAVLVEPHDAREDRAERLIDVAGRVSAPEEIMFSWLDRHAACEAAVGRCATAPGERERGPAVEGFPLVDPADRRDLIPRALRLPPARRELASREDRRAEAPQELSVRRVGDLAIALVETEAHDDEPPRRDDEEVVVV